MSLEYLVDATGVKSTSSLSWVDMDPVNLSLAFTVPPGGRRVKMSFHVNIMGALNKWTWVDLTVNGNRCGGTSGLAYLMSNTIHKLSLQFDSYLGPGVWTLRPQWKVSGGTSWAFCSNAAPGVLDALLVPVPP